MPKRKPGKLLPREIVLLESLLSGPNYGLELATYNEEIVSTVYKALGRLQEMGLVRSRWETPKAKGDRPRRVYRLTPKGRRAVERR
jgi:PadR family transcriptional regulator PadR